MDIKSSINNRPVIGILTMPLSNWFGEHSETNSKNVKSFLPAEYVSWIENSGARIVPIQYTATKPVIFSYLEQLNGVILCGNIAPINEETMSIKERKHIQTTSILRYIKSEFTIFQWVKRKNNNGNYFPLLGIGMGYEEMIYMNLIPKYYLAKDGDININSSSNDTFTTNAPMDIMVQVSDKSWTSPFTLTLTPGIFGSKISHEEKKLWASNPVCYTTPGWAMNPNSKTIAKIKDFLEINAIAKHKKLKEYINIYSFKEFPFYGMAFHPEAVNRQYQIGLPQSNIAVEFSQKMSEIFVGECRKNQTQLTSNSILIYNYTLFSPDTMLKILFPGKWQTMKWNKKLTNAYFFGITYDKKKKKTKKIATTVKVSKTKKA